MPQQQTVLRVKTNIPGTISGTTKFEVLDLYSDVPIKINRSYAELQDIGKKNSDYSIGISLPGSKKNNRFFENYYDVDTKSLFFNANNKTLCDVLVNDETYFSGYLRLNSVKIMDGSVEYNVTLYSTVGNLFGDIGNNLLKDLNFDDPEYTFNHEFGNYNCTVNWFKSNFGFDREQPAPFFYPIIHNGYEYSGNTVNVSGGTIAERTSLYTSSIVGSFTNRAAAISAGAKPFRINMSGEGLINNQLKPALSIWNLMKLMFKTYGYSIKSDFMNTPWMKTLYMYGYFSSANTKFTYNLQTIEEQPIENITLLIAEAEGDPTKTSFIITKKGTGVPCYCTDPIGLLAITDDFVGYNGYMQPFTTGITLSGSVLLYLESEVPFCFNNYDCTLKYYPTPVNEPVLFQDGDIVNFSQVIDENIKQIDILSSLAKKFNLVFVPDPDVPNQLIIEPYNYYIGTGDVYDWTDKLSYDKGFTIEPALNYVESNLILTDKEDGDYGNKEFKARNNRIYGQNNQYNSTDFKSQEKKIETIFSPEVLRVWDSQNPADLQLPNGNIKLPLGIGYSESSSTSDSGDSEIINYLYKGAKTKPKLIWNLGPGNLFFDTLGEVYNDSGYKTFEIDIRQSDGTILYPTIGFSAAAIISHTMPIGLKDDQKINNDSLCLLFQSETPTVSELGVATFNVYTKNDAYNSFYANRINNLYSPNTRFLKGDFYLSLSDYKNLKANDIIKINDQYFTWNKIDNYNLNDVELTRVELVQANFNPNTYTTRYFKYFYCQNPSTVYKLKTDFTNPSMLNTNYGWSVWYDYNMGTIRNSGVLNPTGVTSMFYDQDYTGSTQQHYVPYTMVEITETDYNTGGYIDWEYDGFADWLFGQTGESSGGFSYFSMPNFWGNSGNTKTGLNLFTGCSACYSAITANNIVTGSTSNHGVIPTPTPLPTSTPTPTPIPTSPELMRGSLLVTFEKDFNDISISVNGQVRNMIYTEIDNLYSTYIYSGDVITIAMYTGNTYDVIRRDYTTDDQGGDIGIRDVQIMSGQTTGSSITFTATTVSTDYNFEYRVNVCGTGSVFRNGLTYQNGYPTTKTYSSQSITFSGTTGGTYSFSGYTVSGTTTVNNGQFIIPLRQGTFSTFTRPIISRILTYGLTGVPIVSRYRLYKDGVLLQTALASVIKNSASVSLNYVFSGITVSCGEDIAIVTEDILYNTNVAPLLGELTVSGVTQTSAVGTFDVINPGAVGQYATSNGVCWSTEPNPTIENNKTNNGAVSSYFVSSSSTMTGLTPGTLYYARGYATNTIGTTYTTQQTFTTFGTTDNTIILTESSEELSDENNSQIIIN